MATVTMTTADMADSVISAGMGAEYICGNFNKRMQILKSVGCEPTTENAHTPKVSGVEMNAAMGLYERLYIRQVTVYVCDSVMTKISRDAGEKLADYGSSESYEILVQLELYKRHKLNGLGEFGRGGDLNPRNREFLDQFEKKFNTDDLLRTVFANTDRWLMGGYHKLVNPADCYERIITVAVKRN